MMNFKKKNINRHELYRCFIDMPPAIFIKSGIGGLKLCRSPLVSVKEE